jgi:hypothetical protein
MARHAVFQGQAQKTQDMQVDLGYVFNGLVAQASCHSPTSHILTNSKPGSHVGVECASPYIKEIQLNLLRLNAALLQMAQVRW